MNYKNNIFILRNIHKSNDDDIIKQHGIVCIYHILYVCLYSLT